MAIESMLNWLSYKIEGIRQARTFRLYAKNVHKGPAPTDWRTREGIPDHNQWPRDPKSSNLVIGSVKCGRVRPVPAPAFPTGGNRDFTRHPNIICLCGSTRFIEQFAIQTWELERKGNIVLGCTLLPEWYCKTPSHFGEATGTKEQCDELHKRKIDLADEVLVLNIDGYIGDSTRSEIEYAVRTGKPVRYLEIEVPTDAI